jgi:hypothetical protein
MKNLFDRESVAEVKQRIARLTAASTREWGTMSAPQALAHCSAGMEMALGESTPPMMFIGRIIGGMVKRLAIGSEGPFKRNSPTAKNLLVEGERDLETERAKLKGLIDRFVAAGAPGCTTHPHPFFGRLTPDEWSVLMYKHIDHHLRQFGV